MKIPLFAVKGAFNFLKLLSVKAFVREEVT
jgi:hypothetical protein